MTTISTTPRQVRVSSGDAELYVRTAGGSPGSDTLVGLSGGPGLSHDYLAGLFELSSPNLRVVLYDPRGVGRSTGSLDGNLLENQVRDLAAVQESLGVQQAHLCGHSAGGLLLMLAARRRPDLIASAVFVDSAPPRRAELDAALGAVASRVQQLADSGVIALPDDETDLTAWVRAAYPIYFTDPRHPRAHEHGDVTLSGAAYAATLGALGEYDLTGVLGTLSVPALVIACAVPFGTGMGLAVSKELPKAYVDIEVLENCGHLPWLEAPAPFDTVMRTFLATRCGVAADGVRHEH